MHLWLLNYRVELKKSSPGCVLPVISAKRGRPLLLPDDLDEKLRIFINNTRTAGGAVNKHVVYGILMGLIKSELARYGRYLDYVITNGWLQSLYKRMNLTRRMVTTLRPVITKLTWLEVKANNILSATIEHKIPDELNINADQTPSKFVPTENVTMAEKNSKHIQRTGGNDGANALSHLNRL